MVARKVVEFVEAWKGKLCIVFILIVAMSSCTTKKQGVTDLDRLHLSGKISSIMVTSYSIDYKFGEPVKGEPVLALNYNTPCVARTIAFDRKGFIVNVTNTLPDEGCIEQQCIRDQNGEIIEEVAIADDYIIARNNYSNGDNKIYTPYKREVEYKTSKRLYSNLLPLGSHIEDPYLEDGTYCTFQDSTAVIFDMNYRIENTYTNNRLGELGLGVSDLMGIWGLGRTLSTSVEKKDDLGPPVLVKQKNNRIRYQYDASGNVVLKILYGSDGDEFSRTYYDYNGNNQVISVKNDYLNNEIQYSYYDDLKIKEIMEYQYELGRIPQFRYKYEYNEKNQICKITRLNFMNEIQETIILKRDYSNKIIGSYIYNDDAQEYDKKYSRVVEYVPNTLFTIKGIEESDFSKFDKIEVKNDVHGNWISKILYIAEEPVLYYERVISYR